MYAYSASRDGLMILHLFMSAIMIGIFYSSANCFVFTYVLLSWSGDPDTGRTSLSVALSRRNSVSTYSKPWRMRSMTFMLSITSWHLSAGRRRCCIGRDAGTSKQWSYPSHSRTPSPWSPSPPSRCWGTWGSAEPTAPHSHSLHCVILQWIPQFGKMEHHEGKFFSYELPISANSTLLSPMSG